MKLENKYKEIPELSDEFSKICQVCQDFFAGKRIKYTPKTQDILEDIFYEWTIIKYPEKTTLKHSVEQVFPIYYQMLFCEVISSNKTAQYISLSSFSKWLKYVNSTNYDLKPYPYKNDFYYNEKYIAVEFKNLFPIFLNEVQEKSEAFQQALFNSVIKHLKLVFENKR